MSVTLDTVTYFVIEAAGLRNRVVPPRESRAPVVERHPHPVHRVIPRVVRLIHVVVLIDLSILVSVQGSEVGAGGGGGAGVQPAGKGVARPVVGGPEHGQAAGDGCVEDGGGESELGLVQSGLLRPGVPAIRGQRKSTPVNASRLESTLGDSMIGTETLAVVARRWEEEASPTVSDT